MEPGLTVLTRMPSGASELARFFDTLDSAAFDAVYATSKGLWRWIEWAEKLTIRAHSAARSSGRAARTQRTAAISPSSKAASQSSSARSSNSAGAGPTVLTSTLSEPQRAPMASKAAVDRRWVRDVDGQSHGVGCCRGPPGRRPSRRARPGRRARTATCAPSPARRSAMARPIPFVPPVTTAVAPANPRSIEPLPRCRVAAGGRPCRSAVVCRLWSFGHGGERRPGWLPREAPAYPGPPGGHDRRRSSSVTRGVDGGRAASRSSNATTRVVGTGAASARTQRKIMPGPWRWPAVSSQLATPGSRWATTARNTPSSSTAWWPLRLDWCRWRSRSSPTSGCRATRSSRGPGGGVTSMTRASSSARSHDPHTLTFSAARPPMSSDGRRPKDVDPLARPAHLLDVHQKRDAGLDEARRGRRAGGRSAPPRAVGASGRRGRLGQALDLRRSAGSSVAQS